MFFQLLAYNVFSEHVTSNQSITSVTLVANLPISFFKILTNTKKNEIHILVMKIAFQLFIKLAQEKF
jgi:branched-subunit amino acid transport protein